MKIVINTCFGGFGVSPEAVRWLYENDLSLLQERAPEPRVSFLDEASIDGRIWRLGNQSENVVRSNPALVECVEVLKEKSWGSYAQLKVVEIPDGVKWHIAEYDGKERVAQDHETWS